MNGHEEPTEDRDREAAPLHVERDGDVARLSGATSDLEALGQSAAAAQADPEVRQVDVAEVAVEQPDSGLWH